MTYDLVTTSYTRDMFSVPAENDIPSKIYLGCYIDDVPDFRVLKGFSESFPDNTPDKCHKICYKYGFRYFGLTYM